MFDGAEADLAVGGQRRTGNVGSELAEIAAAEAGQDLHAVAEQALFMGLAELRPLLFLGEPVLRGRNALCGIGIAGGCDAAHPVLLGRFGQQLGDGVHRRRFLKHAVGVAVRVAADDPADRIGRIPIITDQSQRPAVAGTQVPGNMAQEHRVIGRHVVHVGRERVAAIRKGGVVITVSQNPFALGRGGGLFPEQIADFGDVLHLADGRGGKIELCGEHKPGPDEMAVPVDEAGQHSPPPQISDDGIRPRMGHDFLLGPHSEDKAALDGQRAGHAPP